MVSCSASPVLSLSLGLNALLATLLIVDRQTGRAVCTEPIERMDGSASPSFEEFKEAVLSVRRTHEETGRILSESGRWASKCNAWLTDYLAVPPSQEGACPKAARRDREPPYQLAFKGDCAVQLPLRSCVTAIPEAARRLSELPDTRATHPPHQLLDWSYDEGARRGGRKLSAAGQGWAVVAKRSNGDCARCFQFDVDERFWATYVRTFLKQALDEQLGTPAVRTFLDLGAGSGGLLVALRAHGVQGVGISRNWENLPYLETMGARGVIGIEASLNRRLPFAPGAFDVVHARLAGLRFASGNATRQALVFEIDRLVRPGGYIVHNDWKLENKAHGATHTDDASAVEAQFLRLATLLRWERLFYRRAGGSVFFSYRKPLARD